MLQSYLWLFFICVILKEDIRVYSLETLRSFCHNVMLTLIEGFLAKKYKSITGDLESPFTVEACLG